MVYIQPVAAEIRRGIKKEEEDRRRQKETTGQKYNGLPLHRAAINSASKPAKAYKKLKLKQRSAARMLRCAQITVHNNSHVV